MTVRVCTGFSPAGYDLYGRKFLETFHKFWPASYELAVYVEAPVEVPPGCWTTDLTETGIMPFIEKWKGNKRACGREPNDKWKDSERANGYSYRFDAVKFCRQLAIPDHAARDLENGDILVWLDADVISFANAPRDIAHQLIGDSDLCFLGRGRKHSEIGFWACMISPRTRVFLSGLADQYICEDVFKLKEWHSAYVFDYVRRHCLLRERDLTPGGNGHVWFSTPLGRFSDHCKGSRKRLGYSPERFRR